METLLQASPDFKGIKTPAGYSIRPLELRFKPALISKGLRLSIGRWASYGRLRFKPALISKGLRLNTIALQLAIVGLQASPDFKGIKTGFRDIQNPQLEASSQP